MDENKVIIEPPRRMVIDGVIVPVDSEGNPIIDDKGDING